MLVNIIFNKQKNEKIAKYYDFLGIEPVYDYKSKYDKKRIQNINKEIVDIGNKQNILVVAASNCKFIKKADAICNEVLNYYKNVTNVETDNRRYMHTSDEMLQEFSYLGKEDAYEIVVKNTNLLADKCNKINPIVKGKLYSIGLYSVIPKRNATKESPTHPLVLTKYPSSFDFFTASLAIR